jgi:hypothetical protein
MSEPADVLGTCVDLITAKGTKVFIAKGANLLPAAPGDAAAYDALTWTEVGMIEDVGEFGPDASIGSFTPIGTGIACKFMGTTDNGEITLSIAKTTTDTGLAALVARQGNPDSIAMKIQLSAVGTTTSGHTTPAKFQRYFFPGLVAAAKVTVGTGDDVVKIMTRLVINGAIIEGAKANSSA